MQWCWLVKVQAWRVAAACTGVAVATVEARTNDDEAMATASARERIGLRSREAAASTLGRAAVGWEGSYDTYTRDRPWLVTPTASVSSAPEALADSEKTRDLSAADPCTFRMRSIGNVRSAVIAREPGCRVAASYDGTVRGEC